MHDSDTLECGLCGMFHNTSLVLSEGLNTWILNCGGNYVRSFNTLDDFKEWIRNGKTYRMHYQVTIIGSVHSVCKW